MNIVAANLAALRERAGMSINQLAAASGVGKGQISFIEAGKVPNVGVKTLGKLAKAMGHKSVTVFFDPEVLKSKQGEATPDAGAAESGHGSG